MSVRIEQTIIHSGAMQELVLLADKSFDLQQSLRLLQISGAKDYADIVIEKTCVLERPLLLNGQPFLFRLKKTCRESRISFTLIQDDTAREPIHRQEVLLALKWLERRFYLGIDTSQIRDALSINQYGKQLYESFWPLRPVNFSSFWEGLLAKVIGKQIAPNRAIDLQKALARYCGPQACIQGKRYYFSPLPETLANMQMSEFLALRFPRQKSWQLGTIAQKIVSEPKQFCVETLQGLPSGEAISLLNRLPGICTTIAHDLVMRGIPHRDVFLDEKRIRSMLISEMSLKTIDSHEAFVNLTSIYTPYRTFACYYSYLKMLGLSASLGLS